jgi:pyridoxamine 5'-phosphate oxidase
MSQSSGSEATPSFYNDLEEALAESWRLIARGVADRRSAFHHPTFATADSIGRPQLRTVILRGCDVAKRVLRFHTDTRSEKTRDIRRNPLVSMLFYDPASKIQLRVEGLAIVNQDNALADAAWAESRAFSRQCYGIAPGPGTVIAAGADFTLPEPSHEATAPARANFCAVTVEIDSLEWLYLASAGHRRARFDWSNGPMQGHWLAP